MKRFKAVLSCAVLSALLTGCGTEDEIYQLDENLDESARALEENYGSESEKAAQIIESLTRAVGQLNEKVETAPAKKLKAMLPVEIPGMTRVAYSASKKGIEGFSFSNADAEFESDDDDGRLVLSITDIGSIRGFASFGLEMLNIEIDEENQDGFQRTGIYKGFKSYQRHQRSGHGSVTEMLIFAGDRFVVRADATDVDWELVEDVMDSVPVEDLPELAK